MINLFVLFVSFMIFCALFRFAGNRIKNLRVSNIFLLYYSALTLPGTILFILHSQLGSIELLPVVMWISITYAFIGIGYAVGAISLRVNISNLHVAKLKVSPYRIMFAAIPFIMIGAYYFVTTEAYGALFKMLQGDILGAYHIRTSTTNNLARHSGLFSLPFILVFPMLAAVSLLEYLRKKKLRKKIRYIYFTYFIIFLLFNFGYNVALVQKYYLVTCLFSLFLAMSIHNKFNIRIGKIFSLFVVLVVALSLLVMSYVGFMKKRFITEPVHILERIFLQVNNLNLYCKYYENNDLLYGKSFPNILHILPYQPVSITKEVSYKYSMSEEQRQNKITGSTPANFVGEMMVNFSFPGALIGSIILGFFIGIIDKFFYPVFLTPERFSSVTIAFIVLLTMQACYVADGSIFNFIHYLSVFNINIFVMLFVFCSVARFYRYKSKRAGINN